jgi:hypothetical protein
MLRLLAALLLLLSSTACKRAPDPLEPHRKLCAGLEERKELRAGLTVEQCAKDLKAAADLADPARIADELLDRAAALVRQGQALPGDAATRSELTDTLEKVKTIGRPAVPSLLSRLQRSPDADFRIAAARLLVAACADDCNQNKFDCIVPGLLEGLSDDKPVEVRRESVKGLTRCTGQQLGEDPQAWRQWWGAHPQSKTVAAN